MQGNSHFTPNGDFHTVQGNQAMKRVRISLVMSALLISVGSTGSYPRAAAASFSPLLRSFEFHYDTTIKNIPAGAKSVKVWLPVPASDAHQDISHLEVSSPFPYQIEKDPLFGNSVLFVDVSDPKAASLSIGLQFDVDRKEYRRDLHGAVRSSAIPLPKNSELYKRFTEPDLLVPIDGRIRELALHLTAGKSTQLAKARAIYNYVTDTLRYDKSGTGWGRGDALYACDVKHGNCTDFHSLFIGMVRAVGIPAKFEIGFPLPEDAKNGEIPGYHCWAEFYIDGIGWIPVDSSEASKHKEKSEYFFGALDAHRVQFTQGRDLRLNPPQTGKPLNYFVYPYVEVDGKEFSSIERKFSFSDLR